MQIIQYQYKGEASMKATEIHAADQVANRKDTPVCMILLSRRVVSNERLANTFQSSFIDTWYHY